MSEARARHRSVDIRINETGSDGHGDGLDPHPNFELRAGLLKNLYEPMPEPKYQTVRGGLMEGDWLCHSAGIYGQIHVQIAVRNRDCIKGVLRPSLSR